MLAEHPKVEIGARLRFTEFAESGPTLDLFSYILSTADEEYFAVREELLLRMMDIVAAAGTSFAVPPRPIILSNGHASESPSPETEQHKTLR